DFLHKWPTADRIVSFQKRPQLCGRSAHDRLRNECLTRRGHTIHPRDRFGDTLKYGGMHGDGWYACSFQCHCKPDDRRAARASKADAENRSIAIGPDPGEHLRIVGPAFTWREFPER